VIVAYAVAAKADFLVLRDKDLLSLDRYDESVGFVMPEAFLNILREEKEGSSASETI